jgi:alpha-methylacyl-CoA racemase
VARTHSAGPLSGIDVVELAAIGPVPFTGTFLTQLGAHVTRVERPSGIDSVVPVDKGRAQLGKDVIVLDLKDQECRDELLARIERADVLLEGHRPGVMERLGLGPDECLARNPKLVYARMTGWGQDGPMAQRAGHDLNYISVTGALHAIGAADGPPAIPLNLVGDYGGGALYLMVGMLAALCEVQRGGDGQVVDAAIVDGTAHMLTGVHAALAAGLWHDEREANWMDGGTPFYAVYATKDGNYMAVSAVERPFYREFVQRLGVDTDLVMYDDETRHDELKVAISTAFRSRTAEEWVALFADSDACVTPVLGLRDALTHPQITARRTLYELDGAIHAAPAPRFTRPVKGFRGGH